MQNRVAIFLSFFLLPCLLIAQERDYHYEYYDINNGLSQNTIYSIAQDTMGFMWFGTQEGLNRFDGRTFKIYKDRTEDSTSVKGNFILSLFVDKQGNLWVGTNKGLSKYNFFTESFHSKFIDNSKILCFSQDSTNRIWIGTDNGLHHINQNGSEEIIKFSNLYNIEIRSLDIYLNQLWIGTNNGLFSLNPFDLNQLPIKQQGFTNDSIITVVLKDESDSLRIGTEKGNRYTYYEKLNRFLIDRSRLSPITSMVSHNNEPVLIGTYSEKKIANQRYNKNLSDRNILSLFYDKESILWIGTYIGGINKYCKNKIQFTRYKYISDSLSSQSENLIRSLHEYNNKSILIGTHNGEFITYDPTIQDFSIGYELNKAIHSICMAPKNNFWLGASNGWIYNIEKINSTIIIDSILLGSKAVRVIKKDSINSLLWIGTADSGVVLINYSNKKIVRKITKLDGLSSNNIYSLLIDNSDTIIWIGTVGQGLNQLNTKTFQITPLNENKNINITDDEIFAIEQDEFNDSILWIGTSEGLKKINKIQKTCNRKYLQNLLDNSIIGILQDNDHLWLSTTKGKLIDFDIHNGEIICLFDWNDVIQKKEFVGNAYLKSRYSNQFYFGSTDGLIEFHPDSIRIDSHIKPLFFTKLMIDDIEIKVGDTIDNFVLESSISFTSKINLHYNPRRLIRLEFAALDYVVPKRVNYWGELILGSDTTYYNFGNKNSIQLSKLRWGNYTLNIWSGNGYISNISNRTNSKTIEIEIRKPLRVTNFAYIIYIVFILSLGYTIYYIYRSTRDSWYKKKYIKRLKDEGEIIDKINRMEEVSEISNVIIDSSVKLFNFDFVKISIFDHLKGRIYFEKIFDPKELDKCTSINKSDLSHISRYFNFQKTNKEFNSHGLVDGAIELEYPYRETKSKVFKRLLIPLEGNSFISSKNVKIKYLEKSILLGLVEVGFHKNNIGNFSEDLKEEYKLFINSCEHAINKSISLQINNEIQRIIKSNDNTENPKKFLINIFDEIKEKIGASDWMLKLISQNEPNSIVSIHNIRSHTISKSKIDLSVPINYLDIEVGKVNFTSIKNNLNFEFKEEFATEIINLITPLFINKRFNTGLKSLILPFDIFSDIYKIYDRIIGILSDYFTYDYISIWERGIVDSSNEIYYNYVNNYKLCSSSEPLNTIYKNSNFNTIKYDILKDDLKIRYIIRNGINKEISNCQFQKFSQKNNFLTMLIVPIIIDRKVYGFINVFSRKGLPELFPQNIAFLSLVSSKTALLVQYAKLITSFRKISNLLTHSKSSYSQRNSHNILAGEQRLLSGAISTKLNRLLNAVSSASTLRSAVFIVPTM